MGRGKSEGIRKGERIQGSQWSGQGRRLQRLWEDRRTSDYNKNGKKPGMQSLAGGRTYSSKGFSRAQQRRYGGKMTKHGE